jgi:hypothetical protein
MPKKRITKADFSDVCECTIAILEAWAKCPLGHPNTWKKNFLTHAEWMRERLNVKGNINRTVK